MFHGANYLSLGWDPMKCLSLHRGARKNLSPCGASPCRGCLFTFPKCSGGGRGWWVERVRREEEGQTTLATRSATDLNPAVREPPQLEQVDVTRVMDRGRRLSYFGGSDYLRLSWHPEVRSAVADGVARYGPSACASRMTTGNVPVYRQLENGLEDFLGQKGVTLTSAGYTAPMVAAQALVEEHTRVLLDERAHGCLVDAARLTGLPVSRYPHRSTEGFRKAVRGLGRGARVLVMTDGLFTHSGEVAPLAGLVDALPRGGTLMVDDAHGIGVLGAAGRGSLELAGVPLGRVVLTFTLSKAFGCYGGVVVGSRGLRQAILERSRLYTGNTPVPPPLACGAVASVRVLQREGEARRERLRRGLALVRGVPGEPWAPGPMFAVAPQSAAAVGRLQRLLRSSGIHPPLIRYPNGPADRFFRFALSSEHGTDQLEALRSVLARFKGGME